MNVFVCVCVSVTISMANKRTDGYRLQSKCNEKLQINSKWSCYCVFHCMHRHTVCCVLTQLSIGWEIFHFHSMTIFRMWSVFVWEPASHPPLFSGKCVCWKYGGRGKTDIKPRSHHLNRLQLCAYLPPTVKNPLHSYLRFVCWIFVYFGFSIFILHQLVLFIWAVL